MNKQFSIIIIAMTMALGHGKLTFEVQFFKTSEYFLFKYIHFKGRSELKSAIDLYEPEPFWYVFANYFDRVKYGSMVVWPRFKINGISLINGRVWMQTCEDKEGNGMWRYVDYIDLAGVCEEDGDVSISAGRLWNQDHYFIWNLDIACTPKKFIADELANGKTAISLDSDIGLIKKSFENCAANPVDKYSKKNLNAEFAAQDRSGLMVERQNESVLEDKGTEKVLSLKASL